MSGGDKSAATPPRAVRLGHLWERGERRAAIRGALEDWESIVAEGGDLVWLQHALRSCGLGAEAFALQARMARRQPTVERWEALIASVVRSADPWWARELLAEAGVRSRRLQSLRIEIELTVGDASPFIVEWLRDHHDPEAVEAAVAWWIRAGRIDEAERLASAARSALWQARFAVWRNQPEIAQPLLRTLPSSPAARCLEAIACVQQGRLQEGESLLRDLLDTDVRAEASSWLATVLRKQKRYAEAMRAAHVASNASPTFDLVARLETDLANEMQASESVFGRLRSLSPWRQSISSLEHAAAVYPLGLKPGDPISSLEAALERFGGNHTLQLTTIAQGKLTSYPLPQDPRYLGANILLVLWTRGVDAARSLYRELSPRVGDHPLFRIYEGELDLWTGAYEDAARLFRDVLERNRKVNWAWIGLGASAMLQGDYREAQRIWKKGLWYACPRATLYVYRGECYRRQGEVAKARKDLEQAVREQPGRLSASINLALLDGDAKALERVEKQCVAWAPLLMEELSGSTTERLEKVLEAMRGNRRSSAAHISYWLWGRLWRGGSLRPRDESGRSDVDAHAGGRVLAERADICGKV